MKKIHYFLFFISIFSSIKIFSQTQAWNSCYQQDGNPTIVNDIAVDEGGNTYSTGYFFANDKNNFFISKTNKKGVQQWMKYYAVTGDTAVIGQVVSFDKQGNVLVAGNKNFEANNACSTSYKIYGAVFISKYNPDGNLRWTNSSAYENANLRDAVGILSDDSNNVYVLSTRIQPGGGGENGCFTSRTANIEKINTTGNLIWSTFTRSVDQARDLCFDKQKNIIIAGSEIYPFFEGSELPPIAFAAKINIINGSIIWETSFGEPDISTSSPCYSVSCDSRNNIYLYANINDAAGIISFKPNGKLAGYRLFPAATKAIERNRQGMVIDAHDNICALMYSYENGRYKWLISRYKLNNGTGWIRQFSKPGISKPVAIRNDNAGNILVTGGTRYYEGDSLFTTLKYNSSGQKLWTNYYVDPNESTNSVTTMEIDSSGNIYVSRNTAAKSCLQKIKSNNLNETSEPGIPLIAPVQHVIIFPNPVESNINVETNALPVGKYECIIYNNIGEVIYKKEINIPAYNNTSFSINIQNLHAGVYTLYLTNKEGKYPAVFAKS